MEVLGSVEAAYCVEKDDRQTVAAVSNAAPPAFPRPAATAFLRYWGGCHQTVQTKAELAGRTQVSQPAAPDTSDTRTQTQSSGKLPGLSPENSET